MRSPNISRHIWRTRNQNGEWTTSLPVRKLCCARGRFSARTWKATRAKWVARARIKRTCSVPNMLLARATPRVKRAYFGNKKFVRARFTKFPVWLHFFANLYRVLYVNWRTAMVIQIPSAPLCIESTDSTVVSSVILSFIMVFFGKTLPNLYMMQKII